MRETYNYQTQSEGDNCAPIVNIRLPKPTCSAIQGNYPHPRGCLEEEARAIPNQSSILTLLYRTYSHMDVCSLILVSSQDS